MGWKTRLGGVTAATLAFTALATAPALAEGAGDAGGATAELRSSDEGEPCDGVSFPLVLGEDGERFDVTEPGDGTEEGTLRWAVEQANAHPGLDEIVIAEGLVVQSTGEIYVEDGIILRGADAHSEIQNVGTNYRELMVSSAREDFPVFISQLTFTGVGPDAEGLDFESEVCALGLHDVTVQGFAGSGVVVGDTWPFVALEVERSVFRENGLGDDWSGALRVSNEGVEGDFRISDSVFENNSTTGLQFETGLEPGATVLIERTRFENNTTSENEAGGLAISDVSAEDAEQEPGEPEVSAPESPMITVRDSLFRGNEGGDAGGISVGYLRARFEEPGMIGMISIERTTFDGNRTNAGEADDPFAASDLRVEEMTTENSVESVMLSVSDSTFSGEAGSETPNVRLDELAAQTEFEHVTMVGGGISYGDLETQAEEGAGISLVNSVIDTATLAPMRYQGVLRASAGGPPVSESHMAYTAVPDASVEAGEGRLVLPSGDYLLGALDDTLGVTPVRVPGAGSPLIDAAAAGGSALDQRGVARPQGGAADIGAVEVIAEDPEPLPATVAIGTDQRGKPGSDLTFTVTRTAGSEPGEARVRVRTVDGSAVAGTDYDALDTELVWAEGDPAEQTVTVRATPGRDGSAPRSFTVELAEPGDDTVLGERASAVGTIAYDDAEVLPPGGTDPPTGTKDPLSATGGEGPGMVPFAIAALLLAAGATALGIRGARAARDA